MKVYELIEELEKVEDKNLDVWVDYEDWAECVSVTDVPAYSGKIVMIHHAYTS